MKDAVKHCNCCGKYDTWMAGTGGGVYPLDSFLLQGSRPILFHGWTLRSGILSPLSSLDFLHEFPSEKVPPRHGSLFT